MYSPIVNAGTIPASPAWDITKGIVEITLHPRLDLTHRATPWFQSHGQWGARGYNNLAPGDAIFFDWDLDGTADHVGIVIGTDGSRVYTVEGNSGDACKIKSYDLNYQSIKGYGLMNW